MESEVNRPINHEIILIIQRSVRMYSNHLLIQHILRKIHFRYLYISDGSQDSTHRVDICPRVVAPGGGYVYQVIIPKAWSWTIVGNVIVEYQTHNMLITSLLIPNSERLKRNNQNNILRPFKNIKRYDTKDISIFPRDYLILYDM